MPAGSFSICFRVGFWVGLVLIYIACMGSEEAYYILLRTTQNHTYGCAGGFDDIAKHFVDERQKQVPRE